MPSIQMYDSNVSRRQLPGAQRGANASAASFGAAEAQDIGRLGGALRKGGEALMNWQAEEREKEDRLRTRNLLNEASLETIKAMQEKVYSLQGQDALGADKIASEEMEKLAQKYKPFLKTERQRQLFESSWQGMTKQHVEHGYSHSIRERDKADRLSKDSQNEIAMQQAQMYRDTPESVASAESTIAANVGSTFAGYGKATMKLEMQKRLKVMHGNILNAIITEDKNFEKALDYIDQFKKGRTIALGDKSINIGGIFTGKEAKKIKDMILAKKQDRDNLEQAKKIAALSPEEQAKLYDSIKDPDQLKQIKGMVGTITDYKTAAKNEADTKKLESFWLGFEKNPDVSDLPVWMDHDQREKARSWAARKAKAAAAGKDDIDTDLEVFGPLYRKVAMGKATMKDILDARDSLSGTDAKTLLKMWGKEGGGSGSKSGSKSASVITPAKQAALAIEEFGYDATDDPGEFAEIATAIQMDLDAKEVKGAKAVQEVIDWHLKKHVLERGRVMDTLAYGYQMTAADRAKAKKLQMAEASSEIDRKVIENKPDHLPDAALWDEEKKLWYVESDVMTKKTTYSNMFGFGKTKTNRVAVPTGEKERIYWTADGKEFNLKTEKRVTKDTGGEEFQGPMGS